MQIIVYARSKLQYQIMHKSSQLADSCPTPDDISQCKYYLLILVVEKTFYDNKINELTTTKGTRQKFQHSQTTKLA